MNDGAYIKGAPADHDGIDDRVPGSDSLPDDIKEDDLAPDEDAELVELPDDDLDAPVDGEPFTGEVPQA